MKRLITAALAGVIGVVLAATPAHAEVTPAQIASGLAESPPLYVHADARDLLPDDAMARVRDAAEGAGTPIWIAVVAPGAVTGKQATFFTTLRRELNKPGTYVLVMGREIFARSDTLRSGQAQRLATDAAGTNRGGTVQAVLLDFIEAVRAAPKVRGGGSGDQSGAAGAGDQSGDQGGTGAAPAENAGGGGSLVGLGVIALVVLGGLGLFAWGRRRRREREAAELAEVRQTVGEDVTLLGEDIARLDLDVADPRLDDRAREDYRHALDSYDQARTALDQARRATDVQPVTKALEDGRYYMTSVRARLAGEEPPERRPPCFFNPQHGPSVRDVSWAPPGGAPRDVPACAADAEAVEVGGDPDYRLVQVGGQRRPYWDAGPGYAPYAGGYFGGFGMGGLLPGMLIGTMLGSSLGGFGMGGYGMGYDQGFEAGQDSGGDFGGGGGDFGGGGGGGDFGWGGGDFGGGDFGGGGDF